MPELEAGTPSSRVNPISPSRRYESPRRVRFRRELKEGKSKLTFWAEINGGYEKLKRKKRIKKTRRFLEYKKKSMKMNPIIYRGSSCKYVELKCEEFSWRELNEFTGEREREGLWES